MSDLPPAPSAEDERDACCDRCGSSAHAADDHPS